MLTSLSIRNVVLIEKLDLEFKQGLCVFTGETGAGKSILLDSLSLALGARADSALVRHGMPSLSVSASFSVSLSHRVHQILIEQGIPIEDEIILKRSVTAEGKSRAFINDQPVSVSLLKTVGDSLVEIHGQFASHHLLNPTTHLDVLDAYGNLEEEVSFCRRAYNHWKYVQGKREEAEQELLAAQTEEVFLRESIEDLRALNPQEGEEEELTVKRTALMNSEKIIEALNMAYQLMSDESQGAARKTEQALIQLEKANMMAGDKFSDIVNATLQAGEALADAIAYLERATDQWGDEDALQQVDDRLFALKDMARKHHVTVSELPDILIAFEHKINALDFGKDEVIALQKEEEKARLDYLICAQNLSKKRKAVAQKLDESVAKELPDLKLGKASFLTEIKEMAHDAASEKGLDAVTFLVSTNTGVPFAPIHKIASGGELARFMLALKLNLAEAEEIPTLIFDEVDTGIGGATAAAVGERLRRLADERQVLVVTHSPQVAAYGAHQYVVSKHEKDKTVITEVNLLTQEDRLMEIARMVSGAKITESGKKMAEELLSRSIGADKVDISYAVVYAHIEKETAKHTDDKEKMPQNNGEKACKKRRKN